MDLKEIAKSLEQESPKKRADFFNQLNQGLDAALGIQFTHVDVDKVVATLKTTDQHVQPYGLIHGGIYCTLVETACSVGVALSVLAKDRNAVGIENRTRFHRGLRSGITLTVTATPAPQEEGALTDRCAWEAVVTDDNHQRCANGKVQVAILKSDRKVGGGDLKLEFNSKVMEEKNDSDNG